MISKSLKKNIYVLAVFVFLIILALVGFYVRKKTNVIVPERAESQNDYLKSGVQPETNITKEPVEKPVPESYMIPGVPFHAQAPFAVWDELHNEACEEGSIVLVENYLAGNTGLTAEQTDEEITTLVHWQEKNWGTHSNLSITKTVELVKANYQSGAVIYSDSSLSMIKKLVSQDHPVIVPFAGRLLGNPYFRSPGPVYHMLVVVGYDSQDIIVHEIGNNHGANYHYNAKVFENAWHDWTGDPETIEEGAKNMLILNR